MCGVNIKAVIFDLGNVWVDFDHMLAAQRLAGLSEKTPGGIYDLFFNSEITGKFEEGRIGAEDFFQEVRKKLGLGISYAEFVPIWNEIFFLSEKNYALHRLGDILRQNNYVLALLSNINILHYEYLVNNFPVFQVFDKIMLSCEMHLRKPHPGAYAATLRALNLSAADVLYTDDRIEFIEQAKSLGIKSFCFQNAEMLKADFLSAGVNLADEKAYQK